MAERDVPAGEQEPDDVQKDAQATRSDIGVAGIGLAIDDLTAERPEDKAGDTPGGEGPGQSHDGAGQYEAAEQPGTAGDEATADQPQDVEDKRHKGPLFRTSDASRWRHYRAVTQTFMLNFGHSTTAGFSSLCPS